MRTVDHALIFSLLVMYSIPASKRLASFSEVKFSRNHQLRLHASLNKRSTLPIYNERFRVIPAGEADLHRPIPKGVRLERILCTKTERFLRNDFTIAHNGKLYQVEERTRAKRVVVEERIDGSMAIMHKDRSLRFREITKRPERREKPKPQTLRRVYIPPPDHPLKRYRAVPFRHNLNRTERGQANGKSQALTTAK